MTTASTPAKPQRRMARTPSAPAEQSDTVAGKAPSKLDQLAALLERGEGASIAEMMTVTGWQQHSVRGAMAGALKKRGLAITSEKQGKVRRYRAGAV